MWKKCEQCGANHLALTRGLCAACYEQNRQRKPLPITADRGTTDTGLAVSRASVHVASKTAKSPITEERLERIAEELQAH